MSNTIFRMKKRTSNAGSLFHIVRYGMPVSTNFSTISNVTEVVHQPSLVCKKLCLSSYYFNRSSTLFKEIGIKSKPKFTIVAKEYK